MQIATTVGLYLRVNKTGKNTTHVNNQLNYIKSILNYSNNGFIEKGNNDKTAAVMVILTIIDEQIEILFTHRTNTVSTHKDQVSFPGGLKEKKDNRLWQTAIRETEEEIGLKINKKEILGILPTQKSISGFQIQPFVCFIEKLPDLKINYKEVKHTFTISLDWILNRKNWNYQVFKSSNRIARQVVVYQNYKNEIVWGITGQILVSLAEILLWQ